MIRFKTHRLKEKTQGLYNFSDYKKASGKAFYGIAITILLLFVFIAITPILYLFFSSLKTLEELNSIHYTFFPKEWDFAKIGVVWTKVNFGQYFLNTFILVIGCVVCSIFFNALLAYGTAIVKPAGYKIIHGLVMLGYMIPTTLAILPLFLQIAALKDADGMPVFMNTYWPLCLAYGANAYYYMLFRNHFEKLPVSLMEASSIDGAGNMETFLRVVLPLSRSIIGIVAIFSMTASYSDFLLPYLILQDDSKQTLMVKIFNLSSATTLDPSEFLLVLSLSIIPQIIIFVLFQKQIMGSNANSGMKE